MTDAKSYTVVRDRYERQLERVRSENKSTVEIEATVAEVMDIVGTDSGSTIVVYGEPQSGKTEMMICLTARLLDEGQPIIIHLVTDNLDLLSQSASRFRKASFVPAPKALSEFLSMERDAIPAGVVVFCKKNASDLRKLNDKLSTIDRSGLVVIDDEADFATPNSKVNKGSQTAINALVGAIIGDQGVYIGVTATPARLDLNNTFGNTTENGVYFAPHQKYTGQEVFFPLEGSPDYRLVFLDASDSDEAIRAALLRFLVTSATLNTASDSKEESYSFLIHTSGKKSEHETVRGLVERVLTDLARPDGDHFGELVDQIRLTTRKLYPDVDRETVLKYILQNITRYSMVVINSERDRRAAGNDASTPSSPFTIMIGGNIVSRGVTFENLLSMYFTRDVQGKLQQDTYIQRARMFGARGKHLIHFELTIPDILYDDWRRCFVFHRLALESIKNDRHSPVWIGDGRIAVASNPSIDRTTVDLDQGEMSFGMFEYNAQVEDVIATHSTNINTLSQLQSLLGESALPSYLINFIDTAVNQGDGGLAIHPSSSIEGYKGSVDHNAIARRRGFIGVSQLERRRFPSAKHHIKIFRNGEGVARVFYKYEGNVTFIRNFRME